MSKTKSQVRKQKRKRKGEPDKPMLFSMLNYSIMMAGVSMVIIGFLAMYIENLEKGIVSLYISPIVIIAGLIVVVIAILKTDKQVENPDAETSVTGR
ncbi:MAG: hypothetical protein WD266_07650 [Balneolales bacterium]